jgi:hypothetical protein
MPIEELQAKINILNEEINKLSEFTFQKIHGEWVEKYHNLTVKEKQYIFEKFQKALEKEKFIFELDIALKCFDTTNEQQQRNEEVQVQTAESLDGHIHSPTVHWSESYDPTGYKGGTDTGGTIALPIREVIAFPKTASGGDPLTGAPTPITPAQRKEAAIDWVPEVAEKK